MNEREFFEEVIQTYNEEEIERLFISESLNELERVTFVIKRGCNLQRSVLIDNIEIYLSRKEVIDCIITHLLEYIEIWDDSLQIDLARALAKTFCNRNNKILIDANFTTLINPVLRLCIKLITTYDKKISDEFLFAFDCIVNFYSEEKINVDIQNDLIELVTTMGSFGKSTTSRRFSVYFCSCFLQISNVSSHSELTKRFILLSSDSEKIIRQEISHQIQFLFLDEMFIRNNIFKIIENFISDHDIIIKSEAIHSFLKIYKIVPEYDLLSLVCKTFHHIVADIKNIDKTYYKFLIKIFREMLLVDQHSHSQLTNTVKFFLTNFAVPFFNNGDYTNIGYLIEDFDKIVKFLGDAKKHSHSLIVNVFKLIVHASFEMENKESPSVTSDSFKNNQHFRDTISSANSNTNVGVSTPNFRTSFLKNLDKILPSIDLETQNKFLMHHFFSHFETEEDKFTFGYKIFFFKNLLSIEEKLNNVEFFLCFYSFIGRFQDYILDTNLDWRIGVGYIKSLKKVEFIYKINEDSTNEIFLFVQKCIKFPKLQIQYEAMKLLANVIRHSRENQREEIFKFLDKEIFSSESFFVKRLYLACIEQMIKIFSYSFLKEHQVIKNLMTFFNYADNVKFSTFTCKLLELLKIIFPHLEDDSKLKFVIFNNLESIRKNNKDLELRNSVIRFDAWYDAYIKNKKNTMEEFSLMEKKKLKEETKFFSREIVYIKATGKLDEKKSNVTNKQVKRPYKSYRNLHNSTNLKPIGTVRAGSKKSSIKEKEKDANITITKQSNSLEKSPSFNEEGDKSVRYTHRKISDTRDRGGVSALVKGVAMSSTSKSKYGSVTSSPLITVNNTNGGSVSILNLSKNITGSPKFTKRNSKINPK